jgi:hypothetical protein
MSTTMKKSFMYNSSLSSDEKFDMYYNALKECENTMDHEYYQYLEYLTEEQIDKISTLQINQYMFFSYLPNIELIKKYYTNDSNKFHGVTKNIQISSEERKNFIKAVLQTKN